MEEVLKKAKTEGSTESRDATSRPPEASLAEANAKMVRLQGSLTALGPDDVAERRVLEDALAKVRARAIVAPIGQRLDECEKFCERAAKRVEKAQEAVAEAVKVQTQREEELAEGKRRLEGLRAEAAAQPAPQQVLPGTDELTHLRSHVAQLEGDLRQSHQFATEKISAETSLKQQVELLLQEVAALKVRVRSPASGSTEMALVPVARSGSALMLKRSRVNGELTH